MKQKDSDNLAFLLGIALFMIPVLVLLTLLALFHGYMEMAKALVGMTISSLVLLLLGYWLLPERDSRDGD
jgi:membrane protein implicated in regulation of membrane protease activity